MTIRTLAVLAGSAVLTLSLSAPAAGQSGSETLRTPDGHPDISGVWDFRTVTPLERPEEFADQAFLSEEEVAAYAAERVRESNADRDREERKLETTDRGQVNGTRESRDPSLSPTTTSGGTAATPSSRPAGPRSSSIRPTAGFRR